MPRLNAAPRGFAAHSRATFLQRAAVLTAATITATASLPGWAAWKPWVTTRSATDISATGAKLNGTVNPVGDAATVAFDYGTTTNFGSSLPATPASLTGYGNSSVRATVTGLQCATKYYFRVHATNRSGMSQGSALSFTTGACGATTPPPITAPTAITNPATATATTATLNASVSPNGASTAVSFEHGATTAYGATISAIPATIGASAGATSASAVLSGLACGKTYNYRVRATNSAGTTLGGNVGFATAACDAPPPPVLPVAGKAYYISTTGNNANDGLSAAAPFQTFAKAWAVLQPGDALVVADGSYSAVSPPAEKSGTAEKPIAIRAANPGKATLASLGFKGNAHLAFVGFRIAGTDNAVNVVSNGNGKPSHHLTFREIGFSCTPNTLNDDACFSLSDGTNNVLLEDSWGWGGGRYTVMCYGGPGGNPPNTTCDNNTFRRVVLRMGPAKSSSGNPQASLALYYASNNIVENVIAIDGQAASNSSNSAFYITGHEPPPNADGNRFYGVIALNNRGQGFFLDCPGAVCNGTQVRDSVFWSSAEYGVIVAGGSGISRCNGVVLDHNTIGTSEEGSGFENYACSGATLTNNAIVGNAGFGAHQSPSAGSTTGHHNGYFGNVSGARSGVAAGTGDLTTNPALAFITRIEAGSPYKGAGATGDIGANVVNRHQDGVPTSTPLWPWPNEARIKTEMCAQTTGGFCSGIRLDGVNAVTLTSYIWEYEGQRLPTGIYP